MNKGIKELNLRVNATRFVLTWSLLTEDMLRIVKLGTTVFYIEQTCIPCYT